ncbi:MAG: caspase family protein [Candidatus Moraniibacteriota bacterium]
MKKILAAILVATFFLGSNVALAQNNEPKKAKAKNVQIKTKKPISDKERKLLEELYPKGKPSSAVDATTKFVLPATGTEVGVSEGGNRYAIVIGMANYPGTTYDLCVSDAKTELSDPIEGLSLYCKDDDSYHMKEALINEYGFSAENVHWLADAKATRTSIKSAVDAVIEKAEAGDEIIFFFSGHGFTGEYGEASTDDKDLDNVDEAIAVYDEAYPTDEAISAENSTDLDGYNYLASGSMIFDDELKSWFSDAKTDRISFIFDICGAGGMNDLAGEGRVLAMSSLEGQSSYTYYLGGTYTSDTIIQESQGLFSHYFVNRGMEDGLADGSNLLSKKNPAKWSGKVSIEEAFGYSYPIIKSVKPQTSILDDKFVNDLLP